MDHDLPAIARNIIDTNLYMVLATANEHGEPWASPVYFAPESYHQFLWISRPVRTHSRNIAVHPDLSIVIFDSTVPIGTGIGVYFKATAEQVIGDDRDAAIDVFSQRSVSHGGHTWSPESIEEPAQTRLYRATAHETFILKPGTDDREPIAL